MYKKSLLVLKNPLDKISLVKPQNPVLFSLNETRFCGFYMLQVITVQ